MNQPLEFFATDARVAQIEAAFLAATDGARLKAMVAWAWQLRQRDTKRALALADEAQAGLATAAGLSSTELRSLGARLMLVRGEAKWLFGQLTQGNTFAELALQEFDALDDALGRADAHWLRASIAYDLGDGPRRDAELERMAAAVQSADPVRKTVAQATLARYAAFRDVVAAKERWGAHFVLPTASLHPAAACAAEDFFGVVAYESGNYVQSIRHWSETYAKALDCGEIQRAITAATNTGDRFSSLNDHHAALEWMQRGLELARPQGWPSCMGAVLLQTAESMRGLQRFDAAYDMLREALELMTPMAASRVYAIGLRYLGDVELDRQQYASALETFHLLEQRARNLGAADLLFDALCGQAKSLLFMAQPMPALEKAQAALLSAKANAGDQISALHVLAELYSRYPSQLPMEVQAESVPLHYLQQALKLAETIENYTIPADLLEAMAREYANAGDMAKAYALALLAIKSREKIHSTDASNRAVAMQVSHETQRARTEGEHHRQLALAHAERADTLEKANSTLEQLGAVGREITGNLDTDAIFAALDRHVHALLTATAFAIYRLDAGGLMLTMVFGIEDGKAVPSHTFSIQDPDRNAARCARERQEIVCDVEPGSMAPIAGTAELRSLMYAPLAVGDRLLGVMTVQSTQPHAYAERDVAIFRTLCAYAAIALANDERTNELREKNLELERLSVTDRLTGLFNRLHLDRVLTEEMHRSQRYASCFSLVLMDVDHFKNVNDRYGHPVGDLVLVEVARLLMRGIREVDVLGRWGGEEFLVICPDTTFDGALVVAEKLRELVASFNFPVVERKTASFGVTTARTGDTIQAMMARADSALYRSKASGRNRVEGES